MAIDSKLCGYDLVKMKVVDVMASGQINECASVLQHIMQKPVRFEISEGTCASVEKWMEDKFMVPEFESSSLSIGPAFIKSKPESAFARMFEKASDNRIERHAIGPIQSALSGSFSVIVCIFLFFPDYARREWGSIRTPGHGHGQTRHVSGSVGFRRGQDRLRHGVCCTATTFQNKNGVTLKGHHTVKA